MRKSWPSRRGALRIGRRLALLPAAACVVLIAVLCGLLIGARTSGNAAAVGTAVGDRAPDFTLMDVRGNPVQLRQFQGQGVIIHFWAVACTTCQGEQPDYVRAIRSLGRRAPTVLAVDAWREPASMIAAYMRQQHLPGIGLVDLTASVVEGLYQVQGTPTTFFIDRHGIIRRVVAGPETYNQIVANAKLIVA